MISLLDDEDPGVGEHIEQRLLSMGDSIIPRLEEAWETEENEVIQGRIEDIIYVIQTRSAIQELKSWKENGGGSLLRGWFLLTQYQFPDIQYIDFKNVINRLVNKIWLELRSGMNTVDKLRVVTRMLFEKERFKPARKLPYEPANYFLNSLVERKKGGPISLGIFYMIICHELDLHVQGVILPGYFVLTVPGHEDELYIDIFNRGTFFTQKDLTRYLKDMNVSNKTQYYMPVSKAKILRELIQTIIICYQRVKKQDKVKELEFLLKELGPDSEQ